MSVNGKKRTWLMIGPDDMTIPCCVTTAEDTIARIQEHHTRWLRASKAPAA